MPIATFFLSTGRCGTQWLTETLRTILGEHAEVEHEPLHNDYAPRRMLGLGDPANLGARSGRRIAEHAARIEHTLHTRDYVETGHPCWSTIPWLLRRFSGRVRVVHVTRHPVPTACSWVSHGAFVPPVLPHLPVKELISPADAGTAFPHYAERWPQLDPYQKALVYWAEVNAFGLRLETNAVDPWMRVRYEDIFDPASNALGRLLSFLGVKSDASLALDRNCTIDQYQYLLDQKLELGRIDEHPAVIRVAGQLGYDPADPILGRIAARFR